MNVMKMKNRRILYVVSCLLCLVLALTGCGVSGTTDMDTRGVNDDAGTVKKQLENSKVIEQTEEYTVYELSFAKDGMNIYGQFYIPSGNASQYPITIIGHGFASSYSYTAAYAEYLAKAGIAAYVFDFCGGSSYSESDGSMKDMSVLTERDDMETVLNGILQFDFVDADNVFLMGESQGGMVAALLAAKRSEDVKGLVLFYPAFVIPDYARSFYSDVSQVPENPNALGRMVGRRYYTDVIDMNVYDEIKGYEKDVLIVHGNNDNTVPISYSERAIKTYSSAQLLVMDGAGHGFSGSQLQNACNAAVDFIAASENASDSTQKPNETTASGSKILVAYFSLAGEQYDVGTVEKGNTAVIAEMIAGETGADLFQIEPVTPYPTTYKELLNIAQKEISDDSRPEISSTVDNMDDYDVVYIGYPIWYGEMPKIVYNFIESYDFTGKTVIPFCTHGGSGLAGTESEIAKICDGATMESGFAIEGKTAQDDQDKARSNVEEWLKEGGLIQ